MNKLAGEKLSKARELRGYTQAQMAGMLAERLGQGYSTRQYQKLEFGQFPKLKRDIVKELDNILSTNLHELIYEQKASRGKLAIVPKESGIDGVVRILAEKIEKIEINSDETNSFVKAILTSQIGYGEAIGNSLDRLNKAPEGTTGAVAGTIEERIWKMLQEKGISAIVRS